MRGAKGVENTKRLGWRGKVASILSPRLSIVDKIRPPRAQGQAVHSRGHMHNALIMRNSEPVNPRTRETSPRTITSEGHKRRGEA